MATSTEYQQALKLVKDSGRKLSYSDAVKQVRSQAIPTQTPSPVAGQIPTVSQSPTPVAPVTDNASVLAQNQAKRQEMIASGQVPGVGKQNNQISAPLGNTQESMPQMMSNGMSVNDYNAFKKANPNIEPTQQDINNVNNTTSTSPDKTAEIQAQNQAKLIENQQQAQLKEQERQKIAQETAQANVPTNQQDILNQMISGVGVKPQPTAAYRAANYMYTKYNKYNAMTPSQLEMSLKNGEISTDMDRLLSSNPNYVEAKRKHEEYTKVETLNNTMRTLNDSMSGTTPEPVDEMQALADKIIKSLNITDKTYEDAYAQYVSGNPQVVQYTQQLSGINRDIAGMTQKINDGYKQLASEKGDMPAASYLLYAQNQMSEATDYLNALNNTKTYLQADLTNAMEVGKAQFDAVSKDIDNALSQKNSVISQLIQQQFSLAGKEAEADLAAKIEKEAMNDPAKAIANVMATYAEMGIPFTQSIQAKVIDAENFIAQGGTLSGYLDKMIKDIQAKPEFQAYQSKQSGTEWQSTNITRYNPSTGANESTPIFYRKKTSGGFEAVDLAGNPIDINTLTGGVGATGAPGTLPTSFTGDTTSYIASKEGFRDTAYQDSAGVWTIGYGTTKINGKPVQPGQKITQTEAQKLLEQDIASHSNWKKYIDESTLSESQKTALASFEYNLGPGIWDKSAMNIIDMIKSGDLAGAGKEMQKYVNAGGKFVQGLANRRAEEAQLLQSTGVSTSGKTFSPLQTKEFESYDGKTIPAQYKTPVEQDQFVKDYNEWRLNSISNPIKTGEDILKIQLSDKATEQEKNAIQYGSRMLNAINDLGTLEDIYSKLPLKDQIYQEYAPNLLKSDNQKTLESRKKDFITAVLRKESGASIAPSEFANEEKKYFAQPGDSPSVIAAKQNARNFAIKAILSAAGKDVNGKLVASLYNPEAIISSTNSSGAETIEQRLARIRNQ